jgi:hypothetical protein
MAAAMMIQAAWSVVLTTSMGAYTLGAAVADMMSLCTEMKMEKGKTGKGFHSYSCESSVGQVSHVGGP